MMDSLPPLSSFPLLRTSDVEEMRTSLERIYVKPVVEIVDHDTSLRVAINYCQLQHISIGYMQCCADIRWQFPPSSFVAQMFPTNGKSEIGIDGTSVQLGRDQGALISPGMSFSMKSSADYERINLAINARTLASKLAAMTGKSADAALRMTPAQNFMAPSARMLRENFMFFVNQLSVGGPLPPLVLAEFEEALMVMFLNANQHNYSHLLEQQPADVTPREVRRTEEYIEANWDKPLNLETLAVVTGVSIRSLSRKFRQTRGYTLDEFLRQVRLHQARAALCNPEPAATVVDIARRCGFSSLVRFKKDYFQVFGERPSATLARYKQAASPKH